VYLHNKFLRTTTTTTI